MKFCFLIDLFLLLYFLVISLSFNYNKNIDFDAHNINSYNTFFKNNKTLTNNYLIKKCIILLLFNYITLVFLLNYIFIFEKI